MDYNDGEVLGRLYRNAVDHREERMRGHRDRVERLLGTGYKGTMTSRESFVNHQYAFLSVMTPRASAGIPKVSVKSTRGGVYGEVAEAHSFFGSKWARDHLGGKFRARLFMDYAMYWGVLRVNTEPSRDDPRDPDRETIRVTLDRIRVDEFFIDPHCESLEEATYMGHVWIMDREDLLARAENEDGWNKEAIRNLPKGTESYTRELEESGREKDRDEIVGVDWWIPGWQTDEDLDADDGFHGTVLTTVCSKDGADDTIIREPRAFWGPKSGPYCLEGHMHAPGSPWPLSPLSASEPFEEALAEAQEMVNRAVRQYKRIVLVPAGTKDSPDLAIAAKKVAGGHDSLIVEVPGMPAAAKPEVVEIGGVTEQQLRNLAVMREQLQTNSGLDSAAVGDVVGRGTATEHAIADAGAQTRMGGIMDRYTALLNEAVRKVLWYAYYGDNMVVALGDDAAEAFGMGNPIMDSGEFDASDLGAFEDVIDAEIEVMSISRTTEASYQARVQGAVQTIASMAPLMRQFPEWDWKSVVGYLGDSLNIPTMADLWDETLSRQLMGMQPEQGVNVSMRLGQDVPTPREGAAGRVDQTGRASGAQASVNSGAAQTGAVSSPAVDDRRERRRTG